MYALQVAVLVLAGVALVPPAVSAVPAGKGAGAAGPPRFDRYDHFLRHRLRYVPPPPPPPTRGDRRVNAVQELTVQQILDHFNPKDSRTWTQRYFARADLYEDGGPAFVFIGGEGQENAPSLQDYVLFMTFLAESFKAKTFNLEHRYYGKSQPTADLTTASLQYLSADQALADLAYFIAFLKDRGDIEAGQKVVVFGGSYPGNLAAWARYKFPHLIDAAVSSSAPVKAEADFVEYMEVVGRSIVKKAGQSCYDNVKKATDRIVKLLKTTDGYKTVRDKFHVASDLKAKQDLDSFFVSLSGPFAQAVQYNQDADPTADNSIRHVCSSISGNLTADQAVTRLANLVLGTQNIPGVYYDWSYQGTVNAYLGTEYTADANDQYDAGRQWLYQTCSEFGYYQTYSAGDTPFPKGYNDVAYHSQLCKDVFGTDFGKDVLDAAVRRTNLIFGSLAPKATNVIYVNGDIDPWHALGILTNVSSTAPAVYIPGCSHCGDMNYPNLNVDSPDVTAAHQKIHDFVHAALYEDADGDPADE